MSSDSFKVKNSLNIDPKASPTMDQNGDIAVDSSTNKLKVRLNGTTENVASEAYVTSAVSTHESDTTNIHGIADTSILVTTTGTQVITNKDIDGGTAANNRRITLPKDVKTNLDALTRKQGTLLYDTTSNKPYYDDGSTLKVIGSGSGGAVNYIDDGDAEAGNIFSTYALTESVTFQDTGDTVTLTSHGLQNGQRVSFSSITSTTGISTNTAYFVISAATNTFQLASTSGGSALALTTNGSGTMRRARPVTGTGGSPGVTASTTSTSPLSGTNSFTWAKDAANRMGEGFSRAFTVPISGQAKVLEISFDYIVNAGTFAAGSTTTDSDLIVYIYDVTNSTLIEPSSIKLLSNSSTISDRFVANFQTSATGTSYRLLIHVANPSTSSFTIEADSIRVGPCNYVYGTPITDFQTWTPTINGLGTATISTFKYRRAGDRLEGFFTFQSGTHSATLASFTLPTGLNHSSSNNTIVGNAMISTTPYTGALAAFTSNTTLIYIVDDAGIFTDATAGNTWANTNVFSGSFSVPISGWSSSSQVSDGFDGREISAKYTGTPTGSIGGATYTITYPTRAFDSTNSYSGGTYTVPSSGRYHISAVVEITGTEALDSENTLFVFVNGTVNGYLGMTRTYNNVTSVVTSGSGLFDLRAGDAVTIRFFTNVTGAAYSTTTVVPSLNIHKLSSPTTTSATELVSAIYGTTSQTITNGGTRFIVNASTALEDTFAAVTTGASWKFTAPMAGLYEVKYVAAHSSVTLTTGASLEAEVYKNGALYKPIARYAQQAATAISPLLSGAVNVRLNAGDYIDVREAVGGSVSATISDATIYIARIK